MSPGAADADRLRAIIAVSTEIAAARLELEEIMHLVARRATDLTGAEGSSIEIDGEETGSVDLASNLAAPLEHGGEQVGFLRVHSHAEDAFDDGDLETLSLLAGVVSAHLGAALHEPADDPLTGLQTGSGFERALRGEVARASRYGLRLSLALLDVDGLERINAAHGRDAGDEVLRRIGTVLGGVRASDLAFRLDGGKFALLLPNTPRDAAAMVAARASDDVGTCELPAGHVHVSHGVAEAGSADAPGLLAAAEAALAAAKGRGLRAA
jgi:diguanylate cyclase (GGDEF)-like protein